MNTIESMAEELARLDDVELMKLKEFSMEAMQVKKGQKDSVRRILDVFAYFVKKGVKAENIMIDHKKPDASKILEPSTAVSGSPYNDPKDHMVHMAKSGRGDYK